MNFRLLFTTLALSGLAGLNGCAATTDSAAQDEATNELGQTNDELAMRHHFDVLSPSIEWRPGCGIMAEGQPPCSQGMFFTYTRKYIDLKFVSAVKVDNIRNVITLTTDTWSEGKFHALAAVQPETIAINPAGLEMGKAYKVVTKNYVGKTLATESIFTGLAM